MNLLTGGSQNLQVWFHHGFISCIKHLLTWIQHSYAGAMHNRHRINTEVIYKRAMASIAFDSNRVFMFLFPLNSPVVHVCWWKIPVNRKKKNDQIPWNGHKIQHEIRPLSSPIGVTLLEKVLQQQFDHGVFSGVSLAMLFQFASPHPMKFHEQIPWRIPWNPIQSMKNPMGKNIPWKIPWNPVKSSNWIKSRSSFKISPFTKRRFFRPCNRYHKPEGLTLRQWDVITLKWDDTHDMSMSAPD